ncbi:MAG TPA: mechanosensitive ion channel family protein, partial [Natrialbaceae archaeon]|nr:mechanosensitive ion channel family protein [Natrialbaceae archaeon]
DLERAIDVAYDALDGIEGILRTPSPVVDAKRFEDSAVVLGVRVWIANPGPRRKWQTRTRVIGAITDAFDEADVEVPFPQRTVSMRGDVRGLEGMDETPETSASPSTDGGGE